MSFPDPASRSGPRPNPAPPLPPSHPRRYNFQSTRATAQPGSLDAENGIYATAFDVTGTRFITAEADKTIKIWSEDANAVEEEHPIDMKAWRKACLLEERGRY